MADKTMVDYTQKIKPYFEGVAPIEPTTTAASPHAVGSLFYLDGDLVRATSAIAVNDTIVKTEGATTGNCEDAGDIATLLAGKQDTLTFDNVPTKNSNNPVKSGGVYSAEADIFAVMGQNGAKNLIPYDIDAMKAVNVGGTWSGNEYTYNGITFAVNSDGTITVSGIASALTRLAVTIAQFENGKAYTMTGCPEGGNHVDTYTLYTQTVQNYDDGEGVTFNWSSSITSIAIAIFSGVDLTTPITFKPMLRLASDTDTTYQPYSKTNQKLTAENQTLTNQVSDISDEIADMNNVLGAKNLLPNNVTNQTVNGVTFTVNDDGSITANGTATSQVQLALAKTNLEANKYKLSGVPNGSAENTYFMIFYSPSNDRWHDACYDTDADRLIIATYSDDELNIIIRSGQTVSDITFKPMIRPASIQDDTYVPYSMTNREVTPYVQAISNPNLLDNPWFTVNQRGQSSYISNNTTNSTVDRWRIHATNEKTMNVTDDGVEFPNGMTSFYETLEPELVKKLKGKTVTLSVKFTGMPTNDEFFGIIADGHSWYVPSQCYFKSAVNGIASITFEMPSFADTNRYHVWMYIQSALTIHAVKLELGEVSTLASDTAPNYATELLKCQRYFVRIGKDGEYVGMGMGQARSQTLCSVHIPSPVQMRAKPTLTISGNVILRNGNNIAISTSGNVDSYPANEVILALTTTGLTAGSPYDVFTSNNNAYIDLSADL